MLLALNMKGFDIVVTTLNTTIEHSDEDTVSTLYTTIEHSDKTTTSTLNISIEHGDDTKVTTAAESTEGTPSNTIVTDTTDNPSKILDNNDNIFNYNQCRKASNTKTINNKLRSCIIYNKTTRPSSDHRR